MFSTYLSRGLFKPRLIFARINGPVVSYQCFLMVPSVDKLGNIFVRNIVSYQCFLMVPSVDKLGKFLRETLFLINVFLWFLVWTN